MGLFSFNMKKTTHKQFFNEVLVLNEAEELVAISEKLFLTKIDDLEGEMCHATTQQERENIHRKANILYCNYQKSLCDIEEFVRDVCLVSKIRI